MAFDVGAIVGRLELKKGQWDQSIKKVKADQNSLSGMVLRNSQQFKKMGRSMTIAGTAIVGTIGLMVNAYGQFDRAMTESLAIMGNVSDETRQKMEDIAKTISERTVYSAKELAESYFFLASAGMDASQSMTVLGNVAEFAQAGTFDLALATDLLTDAQTALGLSSKDAVENQTNLIRVSDVLVGANTLANASVKQFAESLTNKAAAALSNVNKEVEEGVAVLAAYADKGIKGRLAGQRLTMMMNGLFDATRRNKEEWKAVGISLWDAEGQMRHTGDIIGDLEVLLGKMTPEMREATLATLGFNLRTKDSILTLLGSSEKIKTWSEELKNMGGITKEVSDKQLQTLLNQFTLLKNKITNAAIAVGKTLGPALKNTIAKLKDTVGRIAEWIKSHPKLTEIIAKSAVAVGSLLLVLGPLMMMLPGLIAAGPMIGAAFTAMLGPIGLAITAMIALAAWTNHVINLSKKATDAEIDAMIKSSSINAKYHALRKKLIKEEIVTVEEWRDIFNKHGRSYGRVLTAISKNPAYAHIREELEKLIKKEEEASEADKALTEILTTNSEAIIELTNTMVDEIMEATLNEFEYRVWSAQQTYDKRKALLEAEGADKEAFVLLERALAIELDAIEKDKTQKFKDGWEERGRAVTAGLLKWHEEEKNYAAIIAGYVDLNMQNTLKENDYKLFLLDTWYETEVKKLWDLYGENERYYEALAELDRAYSAQKAALDQIVIVRRQKDLMDAAMQTGAILSSLGQHNKALAYAGAVINTAVAVTQALRSYPPPLSFIMAGLQAAAGAVQVAAIAKQSIPSAEEGAYLTKPTVIEAGHRVGELVSPVPMMRTVFKETLRETGIGMRINLNFYGPIISTTGLSEIEVDQTAEYFLAKMKTEIERYGDKANG